jgi:hypothetical protein
MTLSISTPTVKIDGTFYLVCQYFAACQNPTLKAVDNPATGITPVCQRCATRMGIPAGRLMDCELLDPERQS